MSNIGVQNTIDLISGIATHPLWNAANTRIGVGDTAPIWTASTAFVVGNEIRPRTTFPNLIFRCTTGGTTGTTEPVYPTAAGGTVTDGTVVWTAISRATTEFLRAVASRRGWEASRAYTVGSQVRPITITGANLFIYECTTAGTSAATQPIWPTTDGATITDGTVVWTARQRITYGPLDAGFPSRADRTLRFSATFAAGVASYEWCEISVVNGPDGAAVEILNLVFPQGVKAPTAIFTANASITYTIRD